MTKYCRILLRKKIVSKPICRKNEKKHFFFNNVFSENSSENLETCGISKYGKLDNVKQSIRFARCLHKARDTHSEYVEYIAV
jgi:hypothetical protein